MYVIQLPLHALPPHHHQSQIFILFLNSHLVNALKMQLVSE